MKRGPRRTFKGLEKREPTVDARLFSRQIQRSDEYSRAMYTTNGGELHETWYGDV